MERNLLIDDEIIQKWVDGVVQELASEDRDLIEENNERIIESIKHVNDLLIKSKNTISIGMCLERHIDYKENTWTPGRIESIKRLRDKYGLGLKEAKELMEEFYFNVESNK